MGAAPRGSKKGLMARDKMLPILVLEKSDLFLQLTSIFLPFEMVGFKGFKRVLRVLP